MEREFIKIRQALEEHLSAINENTTEIQALFDYLQEVEIKIEKMSQRLDALQLSSCDQPLSLKPLVSPLNHIEKKVFLVLYTEETPLSYHEIANKAKLPFSIIPECISTLTTKGIPLLRSFYNDQLFLKLDPQFKEIQAKENLVNFSLQSFME